MQFLNVRDDSRKTLNNPLTTFFDALQVDNHSFYKRPETFTEIHFGKFHDVPVALKIMKITSYEDIAKQKISPNILKKGGITDYDKEIKLLNVLDNMQKRSAIPYSLPVYFSKNVDFEEVSPFIKSQMKRGEGDKFAVLCTKRMEYTLNRYINMQAKNRDPAFFNEIDAVLFTVLFNVYTLNQALGFVHCDLHISNVLLTSLEKPQTLAFTLINKHFCLKSSHEIVFYDMFYSLYDNELLGRQGSTFKPKLNGLAKKQYSKADVGLFCVTMYKYVSKLTLMNRTLESFLLDIVGGKGNIVQQGVHTRLRNYKKVMDLADIFAHDYFQVYSCSPETLKEKSQDASSDFKRFSLKGRFVKKTSSGSASTKK